MASTAQPGTPAGPFFGALVPFFGAGPCFAEVCPEGLPEESPGLVTDSSRKLEDSKPAEALREGLS
jgi:hypothetical protein